MKKFENRFGAVVELRNIGNGIVAVKVSTSLRFGRTDSAFITDRILADLLPDCIVAHRLYDGSYVVVSRDDSQYASNLCVSSVSRSLVPFDATVELEDGLIHTVHISLDQSDSIRRDYVVLDARFIHLCGTITVEVDEDEPVEE